MKIIKLFKSILEMFEFNKVNKYFKNDFWAKRFQILIDLSFSVQPNEMVGFLGANGAGKTTSLKILLNFIKKDSGNVNFHQEMGKSFIDVLSNIGYLPERPYFYNSLTGREFITYTASLANVPKILVQSRLKFWSERLKLDHALDRLIRGYSKGMLQRLGLISAVIHDPKLLILDEPLAGLDPIGRKEFKDSLLHLKKEGKTIFFSSHINSDVEEICEKVVVIDGGQLVYQGSIDAMVEKHMNQNFLISVSGAHKEIEGIDPEYIREDIANLQFSYFKISKEKKDNFLKNIIKNDIKIIRVEQERPSLEEIIYGIETKA